MVCHGGRRKTKEKMNNEDAERLRGEIAALRNVMMGLFEDTLLSNPSGLERAIRQTETSLMEAKTLQRSDSKVEQLRKEGLAYGYKAILHIFGMYRTKWQSTRH